MKFALISVLLAIGASCISADHTTIWGNPSKGLFWFEENVIVSAVATRVQNETVYFHASKPVPPIIHGIVHIDHNTNSRATASIVKGGINQTFAHIRILSERGYGINSTVRIYAYLRPIFPPKN